MKNNISFRKLFILVLLVLSPCSHAYSDEHMDFFEKKIRPIFVEACYSCHSIEAAEKKKLKGGFYIDMREGLMRGGEGGPAVVPGDPDKSFLMKVIRHEVVDMQMPPKKGKLTDQQIADIGTWIKNGCVDPRTGSPPVEHGKLIDFDKARQFWAFRPFIATKLPEVKNKVWPRNAIDYYILEKLEEKNIPVADVASRSVLARRAYMILTGLAPTKEQVLAFANDQTQESWAKLVDELLASEHFGERVGRHWLDLARFAESNGYAFDIDRNGAFQYRDFVINAMNKDMPYDEFIRLQLAGDLIGEDSHDNLAATGFIAAGPFTSQQTAKERERSRYEQLDDLIATVGTAMLGLSVGCARCHDHKYDPITSNDYYRMITAFEKTGFQTVGKDFHPEVTAAKLKKFKEAHQPYVDQLKKYEEDGLKRASFAWQKKWQTKDIDKSILTRIQKKWESAELKKILKNSGLETLPLEVSSSIAEGGATIKIEKDGVAVVSGENPATNQYSVETTLKTKGRMESIVLEVLADASFKSMGPGRSDNGNFVLSDFRVEVEGKEIVLSTAVADFEQADYPVADAIDDDDKASGWAISGGIGKDHKAVFELETPIEVKDELHLKIIMNQSYGSRHTIGKFRLSANCDLTQDIAKANPNSNQLQTLPLEVYSAIAKGGATIQLDESGVAFVSGENPATNQYSVEATLRTKGKIESIFLEVFADTLLKGKGPGRSDGGNFVLSDFSLEIEGKSVKFNNTLSDFDQSGYPVANAIDNDKNASGWAVSGGTGEDHQAVFKLETPIEVKDELHLKIVMNQAYGSKHTIGKFRLSALAGFPKKIKDVRINTVPEAIAQVLLQKEKSDVEKNLLQDYYLSLGVRKPFISKNWFHYKTKDPLDPTTFSIKEFEDPKWKSQKWSDGKKTTAMEGYSYKIVESYREYPAQLQLNANGNISIWLNGEMLLSDSKMDPKTRVTRDFIMQKGNNYFVMKCEGNTPSFNFELETGADSTILALLNRSNLSPADSMKLDRWYGRFDQQWLSLNEQIVEHQKKEPKADLTYFYRAKKNGTTYGKFDIHHLVRGNSDAKLDRAEPGFMEVLMTADKKEEHWLSESTDVKQEEGARVVEPRLAFANWITDEKDGAGRLLARVIVNRLWKMHMGRGIVASVSDFGETGSRPTHPELLDWLAQELIRNNWSLKSIHRLILNSAVYRQGIAKDPVGLNFDPENTLYWTRYQQRIEGEVIRDRLLQLGGVLDSSMFGPGSLDFKNPRRSIYMTVKRSKLVSFLQLFDAPDALQGQGARNETNSAPQSLTLMNSSFVRDMCVKLAARIKATSNEDIVRNIFWYTLSREPDEGELTYLSKFLTQQSSLYEKEKIEKSKALDDLCHLLVCSNEFVYID